MIALDFRRPVADARAYVSNPFGNYYQIRPGVWNYHSSVDIVFQEGSIAHAPIQSVSWGCVTYADRVTAPGYSVFGNLIVVATVLPDGQTVYCRYAHVENMQVRAGDTVRPGQHLADVGDAFGAYAYHLDFAISKTDILARLPWHWPGTDLQAVYDHYLDPCSFIREHNQMGNDYTALDAALNNLQAATVDMQAAVKAFETAPVPPVGDEMVTTTNLNVRELPVSGAIRYTLHTGDVVRVIDAAPSPWKQITAAPVAGMVGLYCSGAYLSPKA